MSYEDVTTDEESENNYQEALMRFAKKKIKNGARIIDNVGQLCVMDLGDVDVVSVVVESETGACDTNGNGHEHQEVRISLNDGRTVTYEYFYVDELLRDLLSA